MNLEKPKRPTFWNGGSTSSNQWLAPDNDQARFLYKIELL